jgi:putative acetyltransferase
MHAFHSIPGRAERHPEISGDAAMTVTSMDRVSIAVESPLQDDVRVLIKELNEALLALTPPEFCSHMTAEQMAGTDTTVFIARMDGKAIACGALRRDADGVGEVKRMYTRPQFQGRGIGGRILEQIEALARREGFRKLVLETGDRHPAAWRVYERGGFTRCGPVFDYPDTGWSVFYSKSLT